MGLGWVKRVDGLSVGLMGLQRVDGVTVGSWV